jgi:hypothetical protein
MSCSQAPSAATWLLKSLTPRGKSEALLGDLLEEFMRGRSAFWYWRQALAAIIVSFGQELRCRWMAIGFATLWTAVVLLSLRHIYTGSHIRPLFNAVFGWTSRFPFPMSAVYVATFTLSVLVALQTMAGLIGLGIYLLTTRSFTLRKLLRTVSIVLVIVFIGNIFVAASVMFAVPAHHIRFVGSILESTLVFVSLLVAVWIPSVENSGAKSISA